MSITTEARHPHPDQDTDALLKRLKRIEGQVRGVQKMVEESRYCLDILTQLQAIIAASAKVRPCGRPSTTPDSPGHGCISRM